MSGRTFLMAGGGTGGHVIPSIAVAKELVRRGHHPIFVGTRQGMEAKIVPAQGFAIEWIEIGGLNRVGAIQTLRTVGQLPISLRTTLKIFDKYRPGAVFSMGGYVAGPMMLGAWWRRLPIVMMEPNAMPGFTNRRSGGFASRILLSFPEASRYFPPGRTELTGLPVRDEFFAILPKPREPMLTVLITGGSRGSRTLNRAAEESWSIFAKENYPVRFLHQTGAEAHGELARKFTASGLPGEVVPFIADMPAAFAAADVIVCRSGAGAVAELAASGKPSILVPFPFAADNHQLRNAEAMVSQQAALLVADQAMSGRRLYHEVRSLADHAASLETMGVAARSMARPGAAKRAADLLEELTATRLAG